MFNNIRTGLTLIAGRLTGHKVCRRFVRREDGAAAVEFAMVAAPFFALVFAILETAIVFFAGQVLETAAADSARLILTGQAQTAGWNQQQFKDQVCSRVLGLFDCAGGLKVDVKSYGPSFANITPSSFVNDDGTFKDTSYNAGVAGEVVVVTLLYQWPVHVSLLGFGLSALSNGNRLLQATAVFINEPYQ